MFSIDISGKIPFSSPKKYYDRTNLSNFKTAFADKNGEELASNNTNSSGNDIADYFDSQRPAKYSKHVRTELAR
jgi:hypothetical protein